jgi:hypothetical protein
MNRSDLVLQQASVRNQESSHAEEADLAVTSDA